MTAMISRWENGLRSVFAFQHSGRMRHADQKHRVFPEFSRDVLHGTTGMLLEHVVNVLDAGDVAFPDAVDAFIKPADRRTERDAVMTNFSGRF